MSFEAFDVTVSDGVAHVQLNQPDRMNALGEAAWRECREIFEGFNNNPAVRVAVISSTGRYFTSGIDLDYLAKLVPSGTDDTARLADKLRRQIILLQRSFSAIADCRVPVLAAIQGGCLGAGVDLVSACDMRYCTEDAFFRIQEVNIGMVADVGTLQRMPLQIPQGLMRELAYTGRKLAVAEARQAGFVNSVSESQAAMLEKVMSVAAEIASKSPLAVSGSKQVLSQALRRQVEDGLDYNATWNAGQMSQQDLMKGAKAALTRSTVEFDDMLD